MAEKAAVFIWCSVIWALRNDIDGIVKKGKLSSVVKMFLTSAQISNDMFTALSLDCGGIPATNISTRVYLGCWYEHLVKLLRHLVMNVSNRSPDCCFAWRSDCRNTCVLIIGSASIFKLCNMYYKGHSLTECAWCSITFIVVQLLFNLFSPQSIDFYSKLRLVIYIYIYICCTV